MAKISQKIDKFTNSIVNRLSGDSFDTDVLKLTSTELKNLKKAWKFDWGTEFRKSTVYKLVIRSSPDIIQGLVSLKVKQGFVNMPLIESAPHNYGKYKAYQGVPGNLVAFACKLSFDTGNDGFVSFEAKTKLVSHYQKTLKAKVMNGNNMFIDTTGAVFLINQYYNKNK